MTALVTVGDLVDYVRLELNSEALGGVDTYALWKDSELINYIDQAQQEFSRLTKCIPDYSSYQLNITAGTREYNYDPQIIEITGGWLATLARRIRTKNFTDMEKGHILNSDSIILNGEWEKETGPPVFIITELELDKLILWPTPTADDSMSLYCYRAANHVSDKNDLLEIDSQYRLGLSLKVMSLAYGKHDALETEDLQKSMLFGQKWQSFWQDAKTVFDTRLRRSS